MKAKTINLYSFSELSQEAQETAIRNERKSRLNDNDSLCFLYSDLQASVKAIADACNLRIVDYSYGNCCHDYKLRVTGSREDESGNRAIAWFLRILIDNGYARPKHFRDMQFPGVCGFTGVCYDDDIAETIYKELLSGETVRAAFDAVSYRLCKIAEDELDYQTSPETIREALENNEGEFFTTDGERH